MESAIARVVSNIRRETLDLWSDGRGWVLFAVSAGWFLSIGVRTVFPALIPFFRTEFGMSLTSAGLLVTLLWGGYAFGQFPGGILGDRYGERVMLVFSTALSTIAVIVVAVSPSVESLFLGTIAFGFATALFGPLRFTIFTEVYPDRTGTAVGITMAAGNVGNAVLPVIAGSLAAYATWRLGFGLVAPVFAVVAVILWFTVPQRSEEEVTTDEAVSLQSVRNTVRDILDGISQNGVLTVTAVQILLAIVYQGFVAFYPTYLTQVKGLSPSLAATLFGLFFGFAIVVQPAAGGMQDRFGAKTTLLTLVGVFFVSLLALRFVNGLLPLVALTLLLSSRTGTGVINNTFIANTLPDDIKASGLGLLRTAWIAIGALAPILIGALGDRGALEEGFLLLAAVAGIGLLLAMFVPTAE